MKLTFFTKNILSSFISVLAVSVTLTICAVQIEKKIMTSSVYDHAHGIAAMSLSQLDLASLPKSEEEAMQISNLLTKISGIDEDVAQVYIFSAEEQDGMNTVISIPQHLIDAGVAIGQLYENPLQVRNAIKEASETKVAAQTGIYSDDYGDWVTIIEPVIDAEGNVIAAMGMDMDASVVRDAIRELWNGSILAVVILLLIILPIQFIITRRTLVPVKELFGAIEKVSMGQLDIKLQTSGNDDFSELNKKFALMTTELRSMIGGVQSKAEQAATSSEELASSVRNSGELHRQNADIIVKVADGAKSQDQAANESVRVMEEMVIGIQNIAEMASTVSNAATEMNDIAISGQSSIQRVVGQMDAIDSVINQSAVMINSLDQLSEEIANMAGSITGVAAQTNILSLNASIEAARAGEHGKGFAVVAEEIRKLASQSADAASRITGVVKQIREETAQAVLQVNHGIDEIKIGSELTRETYEGFQQITQMTRSVSEQTLDVSAITEQMSASTEEVTASVQELAQIARLVVGRTSEISDGTSRQLQDLESITQAAEKLGHMSKELNNLVDKFVV